MPMDHVTTELSGMKRKDPLNCSPEKSPSHVGGLKSLIYVFHFLKKFCCQFILAVLGLSSFACKSIQLLLCLIAFTQKFCQIVFSSTFWGCKNSQARPCDRNTCLSHARPTSKPLEAVEAVICSL